MRILFIVLFGLLLAACGDSPDVVDQDTASVVTEVDTFYIIHTVTDTVSTLPEAEAFGDPVDSLHEDSLTDFDLDLDISTDPKHDQESLSKNVIFTSANLFSSDPSTCSWNKPYSGCTLSCLCPP